MGQAVMSEAVGATIDHGMTIRQNAVKRRSPLAVSRPIIGQGLMSTHRGTCRHFQKSPYFHWW